MPSMRIAKFAINATIYHVRETATYRWSRLDTIKKCYIDRNNRGIILLNTRTRIAIYFIHLIVLLCIFCTYTTMSHYAIHSQQAIKEEQNKVTMNRFLGFSITLDRLMSLIKSL